ncbi:MAG: peptidylprolyl isomerase [Phocaeicola sp.]|nr:peptidylprolyl isomerase [Phocaeicola sp.]MBR1596068.1 peptidylprolyl isomerase [Phocaeicola sp.]
MNKKVYAFMLLLFTAITVYGQNNVIDEVVWVVGDEAILKSEVENERLNAQYEGRRIDGDPYCVIPEQMAIQKLFLHQAELDSIEVSEQEVISMVERRTNMMIENIGTKEKMEEYFNKSMSQIREMLRENERESQTVRKMQQSLIGEIKIVPAEVRRYFKDLPADSIPFIPTQVEVQIITMEPKIPQSEIDRVKQTLRDYTQKITSGEMPFSVLARLYSEDEGSARRGGELGFMDKAQLVPEYANVAFNLSDPNKVSKIVESEFGYHIIQLIEKRGDRINSRHILLKPKVDEKELEASLVRLDSIAKEIRNEKFTFDDAATYISQDKDTRANHGLMANQETGTARFEMAQLAQSSQEVAKVIEKMHVGEISDPFVMINNKGKEVCAIVKLKSRIEGHKATITEDYQRLKAIVMEKRSNEILDKWIREKLKTTYVRINEKWRNCEFKYPGWIKE